MYCDLNVLDSIIFITQIFNLCYLKKLGIFGSKLGTRVYASAYTEGRLEKGSNFQREPISFLVSCFFLGFRLDQ